MISLLFLALFVRFGDASPISGGKDAGEVLKYLNKFVVRNLGQFPSMVQLTIRVPVTVNQKNFIAVKRCGGVIIRADVVLTAAHCLGEDVKDAEIVAWAGIVDTHREVNKGQRINVKNYKIHEGYKGVEGHKNGLPFGLNDLALLWLEKSFNTKGSLIQEAKLPEEQFNPVGKYGAIVGWGRTACGEIPSMLQNANMKVLGKYECQLYFSDIRLSEKVLCALSDDRKSTNNFGDSGGPFIVDGTVVGISSFGNYMYVIGKDGHQVEVCNPKIPGVYTDVSKYTDWIKTQLRKRSRSPSPTQSLKRVPSLKNRG